MQHLTSFDISSDVERGGMNKMIFKKCSDLSSLQVSFEPVPFPAVTFCNLNAIQKSKIHLGGETLVTAIKEISPGETTRRKRQTSKHLSGEKHTEKSKDVDTVHSSTEMSTDSHLLEKIKMAPKLTLPNELHRKESDALVYINNKQISCRGFEADIESLSLHVVSRIWHWKRE